MKKTRTILKITAFLAILALLHAGLREAYYVYITPQDDYLPRQKEFSEHPGAYDIVVWGDSHAMIAVQTKFLGNAANMSQLGEGYVIRYYKLRHNLRKNPGKITTLILPADLHSFSPAMGGNYQVISSSRYVNYADYMWHNGFSARALKNFIHYYLFPYADLIPELHKRLPRQQEERQSQRRQRIVRSLAETGVSQQQLQRVLRGHFGEQREWMSDTAFRYFQRMKALCQRNDIRVVFVRFPVSRLYFEAASEVVPVEEIDRFTQQLVDDWPGAILLDYRDLYFDRDDYFADLNHLNADGSKSFSLRVRDDLIRLGVLRAEHETAALQ